MNPAPRSSLLGAALIALAMIACLDDGGLYGTGGGAMRDTFPPSLVAVRPVDAYHVDVEFNEPLHSSDTRTRTNYSIVEVAAASPLASEEPRSAPGDPITIVGVGLKDDQKTITISTGTSMAGINCGLTVKTLSDPNGNRIGKPINKSFTGSTTPDETPPEVVYQYRVIFAFSEGVTLASVAAGVSFSSDEGPMPFDVAEYQTGFFLKPSGTLVSTALYTIRLSGIQDPAGNTMPDVEWSFTPVP